MAAILIKSDSEENLKLLKAIAERLGEKATKLNEEDLEDFAFGLMMKKARTGKTVSKEAVMKKLQ